MWLNLIMCIVSVLFSSIIVEASTDNYSKPNGIHYKVGQDLGCFVTKGFISVSMGIFPDNSPKRCGYFCSGSAVFGLQNNSCLCGALSDLAKLSLGKLCDIACSGSNLDTCGSDNESNFFRTNPIDHKWITPYFDSSVHYKYFPKQMNRSMAQSICRNKGAGLATIQNEQQNFFLFAHVVGVLDAFWIGAKKRKNIYEWDDGGLFNFKPFKEFTHTSSDCVRFDRMKWHDTHCNSKLGFVCQANTDYNGLNCACKNTITLFLMLACLMCYFAFHYYTVY